MYFSMNNEQTTIDRKWMHEIDIWLTTKSICIFRLQPLSIRLGWISEMRYTYIRIWYWLTIDQPKLNIKIKFALKYWLSSLSQKKTWKFSNWVKKIVFLITSIETRFGIILNSIPRITPQHFRQTHIHAHAQRRMNNR